MRNRAFRPLLDSLELRVTLDGDLLSEGMDCGSDGPAQTMAAPDPDPPVAFIDGGGLTFSPDPDPTPDTGITWYNYVFQAATFIVDPTNPDDSPTPAVPGPGPVSPY